LEAQSLRAQMNPHFIFNVLNGLQSTLILKDEQEINQYMGHLSNLLRLTLELSKKNLAENFGTPQWPVYCDAKSWDSPWVIAADIQATPTLLLLDQNLKKEYEVENVAQMDLWLLRKNFP